MYANPMYIHICTLDTVEHFSHSFDKCDFSKIRNYLDEQKVLKKAATEAEKKDRKAITTAAALKYGYCLIDGRMEKVHYLRTHTHVPAPRTWPSAS